MKISRHRLEDAIENIIKDGAEDIDDVLSETVSIIADLISGDEKEILKLKREIILLCSKDEELEVIL